MSVMTDAFADRLLRLYQDDSGEIPHDVQTAGSLPSAEGSPILVRVDLDISVKNGKVVDATRIDAILPTIIALQDRGYRPILFGHVGRDPKRTALPIGEEFANRLSQQLVFVDDWLDPETLCVPTKAQEAVHDSPADSIIVLENTRKYSLEQVLWKEQPGPALTDRLERAARSIAASLSEIFVNDAIAANNFDFSTCVLPLVAERKLLGPFYASELPWVRRAQAADAVIISGLKANKLDDLERIIGQGDPSLILVGGSLASSLYKARGELNGRDTSIGVVESDPEHPAYVPRSRQEQARRIVEVCERRGIDLKIPVDFVLDDGTVSASIPGDRAQLDVGPETIRLFRKALTDYADHRGTSGSVFYNGVLGMFEDARFQAGTIALVQQLNEIYNAGVNLFVGGGEGRLAMERFGNLDQVTHAFTAGGTILKAVARRPLWPLKALS